MYLNHIVNLKLVDEKFRERNVFIEVNLIQDPKNILNYTTFIKNTSSILNNYINFSQLLAHFFHWQRHGEGFQETMSIKFVKFASTFYRRINREFGSDVLQLILHSIWNDAMNVLLINSILMLPLWFLLQIKFNELIHVFPNLSKMLDFSGQKK